MLQLASIRRATSQTAAPSHRNVVPQLRALADQLATVIQAGQMVQAREMTRRYLLTPIAWGFLASCLQQSRIPGEIIERVLS